MRGVVHERQEARNSTYRVLSRARRTCGAFCTLYGDRHRARTRSLRGPMASRPGNRPLHTRRSRATAPSPPVHPLLPALLHCDVLLRARCAPYPGRRVFSFEGRRSALPRAWSTNQFPVGCSDGCLIRSLGWEIEIPASFRHTDRPFLEKAHGIELSGSPLFPFGHPPAKS
jgi:hypothetical protein